MSEKEFEKKVEKVAEKAEEAFKTIEKESKETFQSVSNQFAPKNIKVQNKTTMILISFFLGGLGVHRYLMGYSNWWLMLITFGGCGIWSLLDFIRIIIDKLPMADGTPLENN